jgi:hypothetical protein
MNKRQQASGRIGGLTAWSRNSEHAMLSPARSGFRARFERLVDPTGELPEAERAARADRARRAHMLTLAAKSAAARKRKAAPGPDTTPGAATSTEGHGDGRPPLQE